MIPDWVTYTKDGVEVFATLSGVAFSYIRLRAHLRKQDALMKRIAIGNEWNNEMTELLAKRPGSMPPDSDPPPPRPKVATLNDPFEAVMAEAEAKKRPGTGPQPAPYVRGRKGGGPSPARQR